MGDSTNEQISRGLRPQLSMDDPRFGAQCATAQALEFVRARQSNAAFIKRMRTAILKEIQ